MKIKRFCAPSMPKALKMVKEELGADAVILSNKRVLGGVEVTAALDYDKSVAKAEAAIARITSETRGVIRKPKQGERNDALRSQAQRAVLADVTEKDVASYDSIDAPIMAVEDIFSDINDYESIFTEGNGRHRNHVEIKPSTVQGSAKRSESDNIKSLLKDSASKDQLGIVRAELNSLRSMLEPVLENKQAQAGPDISMFQSEINSLRDFIEINVGQNSPWEQYKQKHPVQANLWRRFNHMGLDIDLTKMIVESLSTHKDMELAWKQGLRTLAAKIPVRQDDLLEQGGFVALIGPTGAGKTTCVAKLAVNYALKYGSSGLALVTTDSYRVAAQEKLHSYGRILDVPVHVVDDTHSLEDTLQRLRHKHLILIDTEGMHLKDVGLEHQLQGLQQISPRIKNYLVLPTTNQAQVLKTAINAYQSVPLEGCILTKVDETASLGDVTSMLIHEKLSIVYLSDGQTIPDDIHKATGPEVIKRMLKVAKDYEPDEEKAAYQFAGSIRKPKLMAVQ